MNSLVFLRTSGVHCFREEIYLVKISTTSALPNVFDEVLQTFVDTSSGKWTHISVIGVFVITAVVSFVLRERYISTASAIDLLYSTFSLPNVVDGILQTSIVSVGVANSAILNVTSARDWWPFKCSAIFSGSNLSDTLVLDPLQVRIDLRIFLYKDHKWGEKSADVLCRFGIPPGK